MNRLTKLDKWGECACNADCGDQISDSCDYCKHFDAIVDKLWEYENSGLDPNTVQKVAEFMKLFPKLTDKYLKGEI